MSSAKREAIGAVRKAKIRVVGQDDIKNEAHAKAVTGALAAYGDSPAGFLYIEPTIARSSKRPADLLLCHPDVGILVVEVKGYSIDQVQGAEAGKLLVRLGGYNRPVDIFGQASDTMYNVKNELERIIRDRRRMPLFNYMAAFPNISESDWSAQGYDEALPEGEILFKEQFENARRLRQRVDMLVRTSLAETRLSDPLQAEHVVQLELVLGKSATINELRPPRAAIDEQKRGAYIDEMAALDKYFSKEQQELSRLSVLGHPRLIRGVAGSGKSVVLAEMVARLVHRSIAQPDDMFEEEPSTLRIAVVCFNRALVPFLHRKIRDSYHQQTLSELPAENVLVTHINGLLFHLTRVDNIPVDYIRIDPQSDAAERAAEYRKRLAEFANKVPDWHKSILFDAIFVDEGQDFTNDEYQLLLDLVKPDSRTGEKSLIIFYDDAQNLYAKPRPNWKSIGIDVQRGDRTRVMKECFRNAREVVELAFNVLLGSQSPVEERVQTRTYADVNYLKQLGLVEEHGDHFRVRFAERHSTKPEIHKFASRDDEKSWIAAEVVRLVEEESVRPEDILVLFCHGKVYEDLADIVEAHNSTASIQGFVKPYGNSDDKDNYIFRERHVTLSTTQGAKGYDAQIVFLAGGDLFDTTKKGRASFYVGATRAKRDLYISGIDRDGTLLREAEAVNEVI